MDAMTMRISEFASGLTYEDIPDEIHQIAVQHIVDSLACGYGARDSDAARIAQTLTHTASGEFTGRMIGSADTVAADLAGFVNTAMIRYFDYSDTMVPGGHPSDCLGGLLAVAAGRGSTGRELITAFVASYEVFARFGESAYVRKYGYDQGVTVGIALAAGLGNLLGMGAEKTAHAVSLAAVTCISLRATRAGTISSWKGAATAEAVREAVFLTALAEKGLTGPERAFEGRHGIWEVVTGKPFELQPFSDEGGPFMLGTNAHLKYWPVEFNTQVAVWAARELREKADIDAIEQVSLFTYWSAWHETGSEKDKWDPKTRETADHSLPYIFARALVDGGITISTFDRDQYMAEDIRGVMNKITVAEDDELNALFPSLIAMKAKARLSSGEVIDIYIDKARGHALNRMSREETSDKYRLLVDLGSEKVERGLEFWWNLADQDSLTEGIDLLVD